MPWQLQRQRIKGKQRCRAHAVCMFVCALGREAGMWKEELAWTFWVVAEVLGRVGHRGNAADVGWEAVLGVRRTHLGAIGVLERDAMCPSIPGSEQINSWAISCDLPCSLSWAELIYSTTVCLQHKAPASKSNHYFNSPLLFFLLIPAVFPYTELGICGQVNRALCTSLLWNDLLEPGCVISTFCLSQPPVWLHLFIPC